jgi:hypothetical protein
VVSDAPEETDLPAFNQVPERSGTPSKYDREGNDEVTDNPRPFDDEGMITEDEERSEQNEEGERRETVENTSSPSNKGGTVSERKSIPDAREAAEL